MLVAVGLPWLGQPASAGAQVPLPDGVSTPTSYVSGAYGYDASWPQCGTVIPALSDSGVPYTFAHLGVTHTIAFTKNECLADQYRLANARAQTIAFYVDVNSPSGTSANAGATGPGGTCAKNDTLCLSYNYGYNGAADSYETARQAVGDDVASSAIWWLDVETGKPWSKDTAANAQVLQGAIDFFHESGIVVGAYSILWMWNQIAGASFRPGIPAWITPTRSPAGVAKLCAATSFTGGPIVFVQQPGSTLDRDYAC
jgi:hypothetical protein